MKKGILTNKGFEIITNILWVLAIVSMIGLLIVVKELSTDVKDIRKELIQYRK
jgi:hypothetical protein